MKIRIEIVDDLQQEEVVIRCGSVNEEVLKIERAVSGITSAPGIVFYKNNHEYFFPADRILFFETETDNVYAHTADDAYLVKFRLYELEDLLPKTFARISKSAIANTRRILSIDRNLAASSLITFYKSYKQVYVSRHYYKALKLLLDARRTGS